MRKGEQTKEKIMDIAAEAILHKGFAGTSIDEVIFEANITKGGFFYHFRDKRDLAKALLERSLKEDERIFNDLFDRADELSDDPLHGFLIFLKLFAEMFEDLPSVHPGCLVAAFTYQDQQFDQTINDLNARGVIDWRDRFRERLTLIAKKYPPKSKVDLVDVADMLSVLIEGGIILSKVLGQKNILPQQVLLYRDFIAQLFLPQGKA